MFAGAAREVVFSNPDVIRRINENFIPVALKAGMVNFPPPGIEGALYAELGRSKPAPQGICTANSAGKVLAWALSFDDEASILDFLDHVSDRYRRSPGAEHPVTAERFMKYPSRRLADMEDAGRPLQTPERHAPDDPCPALPKLEEGTLVGRIIGRALDQDGRPVADTIRQEHYMEARFEVPVFHQERLAAVAKRAEGRRFRIPGEFTRALVMHAFLGQLDVNPAGVIPGSRNTHREMEFWGQQVDSNDVGAVRIQIDGESHVAGGEEVQQRPRTDGRDWEHRVALAWHGFIDLTDQRVTQLTMIARGDERLRWGNAQFDLLSESDVEHLMAGHPIDLDCPVRYGLLAEPHSPNHVGVPVGLGDPAPNNP